MVNPIPSATPSSPPPTSLKTSRAESSLLKVRNAKSFAIIVAKLPTLWISGNHLQKNGSVFPASTQGEIDAFKTGMMESDEEEEEDGGGEKKEEKKNGDGNLQKVTA